MSIEPTTLYFDTEKSGESYVHLYANEPGVQGPLWPAPVPVVGVSGKIGQGKTTFLMDIAAGPVCRIDVPQQMLKTHPNGYRPCDTFAWFWSVVKAIPPGKFRVIALDVGEEIDAGCAEWVWENPLTFNTTRQQFIKMSGVYQGIVSSFWKSILMDITSRCETFAFANHVGLVFDGQGKVMVGQQKSKGRPVMKQSASLYINLTREKDAAGNLRDIPSGVVDLSEGGKSRLMTWAVRSGVRIKVPVLPPRMPVATPQAIRDYFLNPPDASKLAAGERAPEKVMTEDERQQMKLTIAQAEAETESLRLQNFEAQRREKTEGSHPETETEVAPITPTPAPSVADLPPSDSATSPLPENPGAAAVAEPEPAGVKVPRGLKGKILNHLDTLVAPIPFPDLLGKADWATAEQIKQAVEELVAAKKIAPVQFEGGVRAWPKGKAMPAPAVSPAPAPTPASPAPAPIPTSTPAPVSSNGHYVRPASLPDDPLRAVQSCWEEFAHVANRWTREQSAAVWRTAVMDRYGVFTEKELTPGQLAEIEQMLVGKITAHYEQAGTPGASPFRATATAEHATA